MTLSRTVFLAMFLALASIMLSAAPGDLDPTFGDSGMLVKRIMDIGHYYGASSILLQSDGKILVSGQVDEYAELVSFFIARFNPDGSPDSSFGYQGMIFPMIEYGSACVGAEMALQPDGKIVAVGVQEYQIAVQRLDTTGDHDRSFGEDGSAVITPPGKDRGEAAAVALQPDGKIVIVGNAWSSGENTPGVVARLNTDGSLDNSFGTAGIVFANLGEWTLLKRVYIQPNGKILAFGERTPIGSNTRDIVFVRYNSDGSLDSSFGSNGTLIASHSDTDFLNGAGLQPDGRILVASSSYNYPDSHEYRNLIRYNSDGTIDTSFSATIASSQYRIQNLTFQPNGKIIAFGSVSLDLFTTGFAVVRLHSNGTLDQSFGTNGGSIRQMGAVHYSASRGVMQPDGKILALGNLGDYNTYEFAIARYQGDPMLSISGRVTTPTGQGVRNAAVTITDSAGNRRSVLSSTLGFYSFEGVVAGGTVKITAVSKRYRFQPVTQVVNESLSEVDLTAIE